MRYLSVISRKAIVFKRHDQVCARSTVTVANPDAKAQKTGKPLTPSQQVAVTVYHRSRNDKKVIPFSAFSKNAPQSFLPELKTIDTSSFSAKPPGGKVPPVHVHHKFVVIDADTANPTIYTGSQNLSIDSVSKNDGRESSGDQRKYCFGGSVLC